MAYTEPIMLSNYVLGSLTARGGFLNYLGLVQGKRSGNKMTVPVAQRNSTAVASVTGALLTADEDNLIQTLTCADKAIRHFWATSLWNTLQQEPGRLLKQMEMDADQIYNAMEVALDAVLTTCTNTVSLATDNTFTNNEFMQGLALVQQYNIPIEDCIFLSGYLGVASILGNSIANEGGSFGVFKGASGLLMGSVPVFPSANITISASTSGAAGYLVSRAAVLAAISDVLVMGPAELPGAHGYDMSVGAAYAFALTEGTGTPTMVKFINP